MILILFLQIIPNINGYLINFVTNGEELWHGYLYMVSLVFVNLLKTITVSNYFYKAMTVGMRIRTGVTSAIYQKSLKLSNQEKKNMSGTLNIFRKIFTYLFKHLPFYQIYKRLRKCQISFQLAKL